MQNTRIKMRNKHKNKRRKRRGMTKKWKSKSLGYRYALPEASLLESTSRRRGFRKGRVKQGGGRWGAETPCHPHNCAATCGLCGRFCPLLVCIFCRQTNFQLNICALVVVVVAAATRAAAAATRNGLEFKINAI